MSGLARLREDSRSDFLEEEDNYDIGDESSDCDSEDDSDSLSNSQHSRHLLLKRPSFKEILEKFAKTKEEAKVNPRNPRSLLDLAASATALYHNWESLEKCYPPLDQLLLRKISRWSFPCDENKVKCCARLSMKTENEWRKADSMCMNDYVRSIRQVGLLLSAVVGKPSSKEQSKVTLKFEKQTIISTKCSNCPRMLWCCHILCVVLHRIRQAERVPVYPPLTEVLADMTRDQLQKLLQCAISDEPETLLPVFSNLDTIQDRQSVLYNQYGAPDPTFGVEGDVDQLWDQSLDKLKSDMKYFHNFYEYPFTPDFVKKAASSFHRKYFQRVPELIINGHVDQAGKALIIIAKYLLEEVISSDEDDSFCEAFTDVERMFSCFISSYGGPIRKEVITSAVEFNIKCNVMRDWLDFTKPSSWSRITSIGLESCLQDLRRVQGTPKELLKVSSQAAFYQPVCASLIPVKNKALSDLLSGIDQPLMSKYDEALPVMLLRFDSLLLYGSDKSVTSQYRLGIVILKKLLLMSSHLSILGRNSPAFTVLQLRQDDDLEPPKAKQARHEEDGSNAEFTFPERQMTLAMLYVCFVLLKTKCLKDVSREDPSLQVVLESMFRAIELGRLRPVSHTEEEALDYEEFCWLHEMENELKVSFIFEHRHSMVEQCYVNALLNRGLCFYDKSMAIGLLHLLVMNNESADNEDTFVKICLEAVCLSRAPLNEQDPGIFNGIYEEHWSVILCKAYKVFFFRNSNVEADKLIDHFSRLIDGYFARIAYDAFESEIFNDRWGEDDLNISSYPVRFVLCFVKQSLKHHWKTFSSRRMSIANLLGLLALQEPGKVAYHLLEHWCSVSCFFSDAEVQKFVETMQQFVMTSGTSLLNGHFQLVLNHVERNDTIHNPASCYVLEILNTETLRQKALENVIWNYKNFTPEALLWIAKSRHEMIGAPSLPELMFCRIVFHLLQLAFYKIRERFKREDIPTLEKDGCAESVKWFFNAIAKQESEKLAKGNQYDVFLRELDETYASMPMFILTFFEAISTSSPLLVKAVKKMGSTLKMQLQSVFTSDVEAGSTISEYDVTLSKLLDAQAACLRHGICKSPNDFRIHVTTPLCLHHYSKADFIAHICEAYGPLLHDYYNI
ncbi:uncharacterized protein LOC132552441 [Ylistrum balloti]|uniref:uncharacterized protein LOC132552441 n=1 Tax=Ylistrum balloti TaxID=509963 RepID=UPI0029059229|nr:uncharacterized protein LOC132552441 [Ylistrum balloti]